jgi:hypothetical protein
MSDTIDFSVIPIEEEPLHALQPILVHLSEPDHEILGFYTEGDAFLGLLPPAALLHEISPRQHAEAIETNATHFELDPELKPFRLEVPQTADTRTVEEKVAAVGLTIQELQQALMS